MSLGWFTLPPFSHANLKINRKPPIFGVPLFLTPTRFETNKHMTRLQDPSQSLSCAFLRDENARDFAVQGIGMDWAFSSEAGSQCALRTQHEVRHFELLFLFIVSEFIVFSAKAAKNYSLTFRRKAHDVQLSDIQSKKRAETPERNLPAANWRAPPLQLARHFAVARRLGKAE